MMNSLQIPLSVRGNIKTEKQFLRMKCKPPLRQCMKLREWRFLNDINTEIHAGAARCAE